MSRTAIERRSVDALQSSMLEKDIFRMDAVLIIEDSFIISSTIQKYLSDMGFDDVYISTKGKEGLEYYKKLVEEDKIVPVILDDSLEDIQAKEMVEELFKTYPHTIIILISATEKTDKQVVDLLNAGIYDYIQKPVSFEKIKSVIDKIRNEKMFSESKEDIHEEILELFKNKNMLSDNYIASIMNNQKTEIDMSLRKIEGTNSIRQIEQIKEPSCNRCSSVNMFSIFSCPACSGKSFSRQPLIEHYECGNVSPADEYKDGKCPKCERDLKIIGVDYQRLDNYYTCNMCGDKFSTLVHKLECLNCNNTFEISQANWITSKIYKLIS